MRLLPSVTNAKLGSLYFCGAIIAGRAGVYFASDVVQSLTHLETQRIAYARSVGKGVRGLVRICNHLRIEICILQRPFF